MKRIGILGGSYNPPHRGHLQIAESAMQELGLDEVWFWVSFNIFKDPSVYAPLDDRTAMTQLLAADHPWLKTTDMEKYFCDTMTATSLTMLKAMYPKDKFIWVFGDDNFASFQTWNRHKFSENGAPVPDWQYIMNNFAVAVMHRPPYRDAAQNSVAAHYGRDLFVSDPKNLSSGGWTFLHNNGTPESSTHIKEQLLAGERDIAGLTQKIEDHIYSRGLYHTQTEFNQAAAPVMAMRNTVPFSVFLLLAGSANLVKSLGAQHRCFNIDALLTHAGDGWNQAPYQANHAAALHDSLVSLRAARNVNDRLANHMHILAALCADENLEKDRMLNLLSLVLRDPQIDDVTNAFANSHHFLEQYVHETGKSLQTGPTIHHKPQGEHRYEL